MNADLRILDDSFIPQLAHRGCFVPGGVRLAASVDLSSPKTARGLDTLIPEPRVVEWWKAKVDTLPADSDFGGSWSRRIRGPRVHHPTGDAGGRGQRDCARCAAGVYCFIAHSFMTII